MDVVTEKEKQQESIEERNESKANDWKRKENGWKVTGDEERKKKR